MNGLKLNPETDKLIQKGDNSKYTKEKLQPKHGIILLIILLIMLGGELLSYLLNEWIQFKIRNEIFPNSSDVKHFSACNATNHSDPTYQHYKTVQQTTASWTMYNKIAMNIPLFFSTFILPTYTDIYGRRFLFILASAGLFFKTCVVTVVVYFNEHLIYIVASYAVEGITGGGTGIFCAVFSYVADITASDNHRVMGILIIEATLMCIATVAGLLTGIMVETPSLGYRYTCIIGTTMVAVGLIIAIAYLPETLEKKKNTTKPVSVIAIVKRTTDFYVSKDFRGMRARYIILLLSFYFYEVTSTNRTTLETIYLLGQPFCWGPKQIGYFSLAQHVGRGIIGLGSVVLFQKCVSNEVITIISTISVITSFLIEGFARTDIMMYSVAVAGIFSFVAIPMIRGMMSTITPPDRQGAMFASVAVVSVISGTTAVLIGNEIYSATLSIMNGFVFIVLAGITFIDFILLVVNCYIKSYHTVVGYEKIENSTKV